MDGLLKILGGISIVSVIGFAYKWWQDKKNQRIELASLGLDSANCDWDVDSKKENVYWAYQNINKTKSPIFDVVFVNHFQKAVALVKIDLHIKTFETGLSGPEDYAFNTPVSASYSFIINRNEENHTLKLQGTFTVLGQKTGRLQFELFYKKHLPLTGRYACWFTFHFNDNISIEAPAIVLNAQDETGAMKLLVYE